MVEIERGVKKMRRNKKLFIVSIVASYYLYMMNSVGHFSSTLSAFINNL